MPSLNKTKIISYDKSISNIKAFTRKYMSNRAKLETEIEREMHKLVVEIKEHIFDFTMLYVRRAGAPVDDAQMKYLLDVVDKAVMDGFQRNLDRTMRNLDAVLTEHTAQENPLPSTAKSSEKKSKS